MTIEIDGVSRDVRLRRIGTAWLASLGGEDVWIDVRRVAGRWSLLLRRGPVAGTPAGPRGGEPATARSYEVAVEDRGRGGLVIYVEGQPHAATLERPRIGAAPGRRTEGSSSAARRIVAPMPGRVVKVLVRPGQAVEARQPVVVVEAMKMENELRSPAAGIVRDIAVRDGMPVEAGTVLLVVE